MTTRKYIAALAGGLALLTLGACGTVDDAVTAAVPATQTPTQAAPSAPAPDEPPLPLPETDTFSLYENAYLQTLEDEGIHVDDETALAAGKRVCRLMDSGGGLIGVSNTVAEQTGLPSGDASFLVGAAMGALCMGSDV